MTFHSLAIFLISWVLPTDASQENIDSTAIPRWERHPEEQRLLRIQEREATNLLSRIHRSL